MAHVPPQGTELRTSGIYSSRPRAFRQSDISHCADRFGGPLLESLDGPLRLPRQPPIKVMDYCQINLKTTVMDAAEKVLGVKR